MNQFYSKSGEITIPWAIQAVSMPHVLKGQYDVLICACFGAGKTISYAYPIVCNVIKQIQQAKTNTNTNLDKKEIYALIIVPNPALASQVFGIFKNLCEETGVSVDVSHVGIKPTDVNKQKREDGANILICEAPHLKFYFLESSDRKRTNNDKLEMKHLRYIVLDEVQDLIGGFLNSKGKSFYSEYIGPLIRDVVVSFYRIFNFKTLG
jgi:superfamily II DNA/RNA helicase